MKTKHSIRLLAVAVLASTLLLGACGNKKKKLKTTMQIKQHKPRQVQRQVLQTKKVKLKLQQVLRLQKKLNLPLNKLQVLQLRIKNPTKLHQLPKLLSNRKLHLNHLLISKLHKVNLIKQASQLMTQRLTANYKTSRQNTINVTKAF